MYSPYSFVGNGTPSRFSFMKALTDPAASQSAVSPCIAPPANKSAAMP